MTDIKSHLSAAFGDEPPLVDDLDAVMTTGRRALRRHNGRMAVLATMGVATLTAAVVVPIVATQHGSGSAGPNVSVASKLTPATHPKCKVEFVAGRHGKLKKGFYPAARSVAGSMPGKAKIHVITKGNGQQFIEVTNCGPGAGRPAARTDSGPTGPKYHYTEDPQHIADRLAAKLGSDAAAHNLTVVYSRPFAQESSSLETGHPTYYDGSVDVKVGSTLGDITVQVNHPTTTQQPFDGKCDGSGFAQCQRTTLPSGDVLQTNQVKVGHRTFIIEAQVSRTDGTLVQVQESNYAFGPDATRAYGDQPLPLSALVTMAEDSAYSF